MKKRRIWIMLACILITILLAVVLSNRFKKEETTPEPFIKLYLSQKNQVIQLNLEEYLVGTVAAEMPASFDIEALKAQAVCARTYAVRKIISGKTYPLGADLSDDITCCQAYRPAHEYEQMTPSLQAKIVQAVKETRGEIMLYQDEPIDALYHSTCGGRTESAASAWIKGCPYLKSVKCQYCSNSNHYRTQHTFSAEHIARQFGSGQNGKMQVNIVEKTPSGRVKSLKINNQIVSGETCRKKLGLPSTWFTVDIQNHHLIITNRGYGHGVGLCQYGAAGMARTGKNYREILKTYYQEIEFYKMRY